MKHCIPNNMVNQYDNDINGLPQSVMSRSHSDYRSR